MARTKQTRRRKKLKDKGKKIISQPDANTEVVPNAPVSLSETPQSHALLGIKEEKNKSESLSGFIFMCNPRTKPECYRYRVFGLPEGRREDVEKVKKGMKLFLYDFDMKLLYGAYVATSDGQMNLEPFAFGGHFPAQVSFAIYKECLPLREAAFKFAIKDNYEGSKFKAELTHRQVNDLLSLFRPFDALPAASMAPIPQVAPVLEDQFQPLVMLPPSLDPYLAGARHGYAAPIVEPHSVHQRLLHDPYYHADSHRPYFAEETAQIARDPYSRYVGVQQMVPHDKIADITTGYYNPNPMNATSHGPQLTHLPRVEREYDMQRENVAGYYTKYPIPATTHSLPQPQGGRDYELQRENVPGYYTTYPIPATTHSPPQPHGGRQYELQRENVSRYYPTYPIPATTHSPPLPHGGREYEIQRENVAGYYTTYAIPAASQVPPVMHSYGQVPGRPGLPMTRFPLSSTYTYDGANPVYQ